MIVPQPATQRPHLRSPLTVSNRTRAGGSSAPEVHPLGVPRTTGAAPNHATSPGRDAANELTPGPRPPCRPSAVNLPAVATCCRGRRNVLSLFGGRWRL